MRAKKKGHRRSVAFVLFMLLLVLAATAGYIIIRPLPSPVLSERQLSVLSAKPATLAWPSYGQSAVSASGYGLLGTNGAQPPLATASVAKVLTALCVLKQKPLQSGQQGPNLTMGQVDIDGYHQYVSLGGSVVPVNFGEQISEYQALEAMLLPSGNNMADSLARWAFGSHNAYAAFANNYVKQLGLTSFHVGDDASGFSSTTVASATDLTRLGEIAMTNPVLAEIVKQPTATVPVAGLIHNYNTLLGTGGIVGIKTGNNDADPGAFLFAAQRTVAGQPLTIIGSVMDAPNLRMAMQDSSSLIDSTTANFFVAPIIKKDATVATYKVAWQTVPVTIVASQDSSLLAWNGERITVDSDLKTLPVPVRKGTKVGTLTATSASTHKSVSIPLIVTSDVAKPTVTWRLKHAFAF